jgi:HemY protein
VRALGLAAKYIVLALALAAASVWLADRPGAVTIHWQGWRIDTTVPILALMIGMVVAAILWAERLARFLWQLPARWLESRRQARQRKGYLALTHGLAAVAGGDAKTARKLASKADSLLGDAALTDLLSAQAAVLEGDTAEAERHYRTLAADPETALPGLRGMVSIALAKRDDAAALDWARLAWNIGVKGGAKGALGDLAEQVFALQGKAGQWAEAELTLDEALRRRALSKDRSTRLKAVSLTERAAHARKAGDETQALTLARSAHKLCPGFVPAAVLAAELMARKHDLRGAASVLGATWKLSPHGDVVRAWGALWADLDPLAAFRNLAKALDAKTLPEAAHLELSRLAMAAKLWGQARTHLEAALQIHPGRTAYGLLARLERQEHQDEAKATHWTELAATAPVDAGWICGHCAQPGPEYRAICLHCGAVDSMVAGGFADPCFAAPCFAKEGA